MPLKSFKKFLRKAAKEFKGGEGAGGKAPPTPPRTLKKIASAHATRKREEVRKEKLETLPKELKKAGVPADVSEELQRVVKSHPEPHAKDLATEVHKAISHTKNRQITEEGLTKIAKEAVDEGKKGVSKEETRDLIREILKSELSKGESLRAYEQKRAAVRGEKGGEELSILLPSVEDGGMIQRTAAPPHAVDLTNVNITYPIIYRKGKVHVYANIRYDPKEGGLLYRIIEPKLSKEEEKILKKIETTLIEELEIDFAALKLQTAEKYLKEKVGEVVEYYDLKLTARTQELLDYYIHRDFIGLGIIEPLMQDPNIEDISCDGVKIPIYIYHRDPRYGSIKSNISVGSADELDSFVMKLAQRCNRAISVADPLLDGALPDGSRVQATYGTGISMKGSNFTIRKFTKDPLTCVDLLNYGTINLEMLAYLWLAIEHGKSILIAGPTACGKTTVLNSLSLFIRPELKIVSIEDTPELRLPHENWISQVSRTGFGPETASGKKLGEISLFDLLKASLRQRPDTIIVGEVRGKEAYVLFQQITTGHPGISTMHAESLEAVVNRLRTPPIELPPSLLQHLDILLVLSRQRVKGEYLRRVKKIVEIFGYDIDKDWPITNDAYDWIPAEDTFVYTSRSAILKSIMETMGTDVSGVFSEVERRMKVLEWMQRNGIRDYKNVGRVIADYYQAPIRLLDRIGGE